MYLWTGRELWSQPTPLVRLAQYSGCPRALLLISKSKHLLGLFSVSFDCCSAEKYDGIVFVYEHNPLHNCWLLTATILSPLASGPNRTMSQGFGYRVDMSGNFLIASTSINNGASAFMHDPVVRL